MYTGSSAYKCSRWTCLLLGPFKKLKRARRIRPFSPKIWVKINIMSHIFPAINGLSVLSGGIFGCAVQFVSRWDGWLVVV
ncbi:hypothetical protein ILYODFUR_039098 [Ilyodon furcidens]|uniref:Uncharacterized protein n=1 Tax=Ilyodon furcidens TaxID=33524 RepID=A0ABV0V017_9TELE